MSTESLIEKLALELFDRVGLAEAGKPATLERYSSWIQKGMHGEMNYLSRHLEKKSDPQTLMPGARSWIVLLSWYDTSEPLSIELQDELVKNQSGWIARYARGADYHDVISEKHQTLISKLKQQWPEAQFLSCVDTKAVMERDAAARAGLGWIGKNNCLINQELGSFVFISEILTDLELVPSKPVADHCGKCNRCVEACPAGALVEPRLLDARKCISTWTIEVNQPPPPDLSAQFGNQFFGCDICQDVCPWNHKSRKRPDLPPMKESGQVSLGKILNQDPNDLKQGFKKTALSRAKPEQLKRNASTVLKNQNEIN